MQYGHFDDARREYVVDRVDTPVSWTNYLGTQDMAACIAHHGGGYCWYKSPQYHRITRFRPNGVPMDSPGHYVYLRDDADGDYWSVSWQPTYKPLSEAAYRCRHGLSYTTFECEYKGIYASQTLFIPRDDDVEIFDVTVENRSGEVRTLSAFGYVEFSFHHIDMDNQNFQMSLYAAGSHYRDGAALIELHYEEDSYQYFTLGETPDGYEGCRDAFLGGGWRTEKNPLGVECGKLTGSEELGGNPVGALMKRLTLRPGERRRLLFFLGQGDERAARRTRERYSPEAVDHARAALHGYWEQKLGALQVMTPSSTMNTSLNTWNLYQSEVNVLFSRFASFIEVGGRTGLGYRDTAQDAMCIPHAEPEGCKRRIGQLLRGLTSEGYGLHLFEPAWFEPAEKQQSFKSPTVVPTPDKSQIVHGLKDVCADDALWLVPAICEYMKETGELSFADEVFTYADGGEGTVLEHMRRILDFSAQQVGQNGVCKGLRADWNDCLNLGGGESAMVSFLHLWALDAFCDLCAALGRSEEEKKYAQMRARVREVCRRELWDGEWFIRGITKSGRRIGTQQDTEGRVHMESNTWAVISGAADEAQARSAMDAVDEYLYTPYGLMLNAPSFETPDDEIGFVTRVYAGIKENGAIFSHPNPWAWVAEAKIGRGARAMKFYDALLPENQNDKIEVRQSEPYAYCQFVMGKDHTAHGRARHPWMTGSAGWAYFAATQYLLGIRPEWEELVVDPCIPAKWDGFSAVRKWRGATYRIKVENPEHVEKGVSALFVDGKQVSSLPVFRAGETHDVRVVMG